MVLLVFIFAGEIWFYPFFTRVFARKDTIFILITKILDNKKSKKAAT